MIRITGGENRSRLIETPKTELTKPTMDKVRLAVFSALGDKVKGAEVLDLFAGSGSYGLEAMSRGALRVCFVDHSFEATEVIKENIDKLNCKNAEISKSDVLGFLNQNSQKFDIVFVDPPYKLDVYSEIVKTLITRNIIKDNGIIVLESERELEFDKTPFKDVRFYKYGLAKIYILKR